MLLLAVALSGASRLHAGPAIPDPSVGDAAVAFRAKTTDGQAIEFPGKYKGKIVLLDFWATWCPPCMADVPNEVAAYKQYHSMGFEVLGISLDNKNTVKDVKPVTKAKGMAWPQVCDGKEWHATVAELYGVNTLPRAFLIDGDSGKILATRLSLVRDGKWELGKGLSAAVQSALANKARATKR